MSTTSLWILGLLISSIVAFIFWLINPMDFKHFIKDYFKNTFSRESFYKVHFGMEKKKGKKFM